MTGRLLVGLDAGGARGPRHGAGRVGPQGRPAEPGRCALAEGGWAATTVSATMIAAARGRDPRSSRRAGSAASIAARWACPGRRRRRPRFDISSDLEELGRTPMAVVCAGPKAILDVPATLEYLETRGVPVVAVGQDGPARLLRPLVGHRGAGVRAGHRGRGRGSWRSTSGSGSAAAILVCVPVPAVDGPRPRGRGPRRGRAARSATPRRPASTDRRSRRGCSAADRRS